MMVAEPSLRSASAARGQSQSFLHALGERDGAGWRSHHHMQLGDKSMIIASREVAIFDLLVAHPGAEHRRVAGPVRRAELAESGAAAREVLDALRGRIGPRRLVLPLSLVRRGST
jgi:hypothetical protein